MATPVKRPTAVPSAARTTAVPGSAAQRRRAPGLRLARRNQGWLYAAPTALFVIVFFLIPVLLVVQMSLSDWGLFAGNRGFNAPDNYIDAVDQRLFWPAVWFTVKYTIITTIILIGVALGLAMLVQEAARWNSFLRTAFLVPSALGLASASLLFYALYAPQGGPFARLLAGLGIGDGTVSFLGTPNAALWSTVAVIVWRFAGFYMLLLLVGLQGISVDVYEAARVDGANRWQTFTHVTLPLLKPSLALCTILCITGSLLAFDQFYILTRGGPDNTTITIVLLVYNVAFGGRNDLGVAAAMSLIVLLGLIVINVAQFAALRDREH
jgi:multiple sugar transport system permease protein